MARIFKRSPLKSTKLAQRKRRMIIVRIVLVFMAMGAVLAGMSWASRVSSLKIRDVVVRGAAGVDEAGIEQIAESNVAGSYFFLLSKANKLIYPKDAITAAVLNSSARIETTDVEIEDGNTLVVTITEREPDSMWCTNTPESRQSAECYLIDAGGYVFAEAPTFSGSTYFEYYGGDVAEPYIGMRFLAEAEFAALQVLVEKIKAMGMKPYALAATGEAYALHIEGGAKILFKADESHEELLSTIDTLKRNTEIFDAAILEYVDLRFGNKVYYKIIGDNAEKPVEE